MLTELRKVIPSFLKRVDLDDRGVAWSTYLASTRTAMEELSDRLFPATTAPEDGPEVQLLEWDPDGEIRMVTAMLYSYSHLPEAQIEQRVRMMTADERLEVVTAYVGDRNNRRHKPGRALERPRYRFDVLADYGAFRDLQRHRLLTLEWQPLTPRHGWVAGDEIAEAGAREDWTRVMHDSAALHGALARAGHHAAAPYAVAMAYRVRFYMELNAREAMHVIELRTAPQGHPAYRRICQAMHRLIADQAGHRALAAAMHHADHSAGESGRREAEQAAERRRQTTS
jgi:hypothetical protein